MIAFREYEPNTRITYLNQLRREIKSLNYGHHLTDKHLQAFIKKFSKRVHVKYRAVVGKKEMWRNLQTVPSLPHMLNSALPLDELRNNVARLYWMRTDLEDRVGSSTAQLAKELKRLRIEHHLFYSLNPTESDVSQSEKTQKKVLKEKHDSTCLINSNYVLGLIDQLLTSNKYTDLAVGIALATGRRLTEVMREAQFEFVDNQHIKFSGQLKTRTRGLKDDLSYIIPVLANSKQIISALNALREQVKDFEVDVKVRGELVTLNIADAPIEAIQARFSSSLVNRTNTIFQNKDFVYRTCREIYAAVAAPVHKKPRESFTAFRTRVLGHADFSAQNHYQGFELNESISTYDLGEKDSSGSVDQAWLSHLKNCDMVANGKVKLDGISRTPPNWALIHDWVKALASNGVPKNEVTTNYVVKNFYPNGKKLKPQTVKRYFDLVIS